MADGLNVKLDFRSLRMTIKNLKFNIIHRVSEPGIKESIYEEVWGLFKDVPEDTGAFKYSPLAYGSSQSFGRSKKYPKDTSERFANGDITKNGLRFNAYKITAKGKKYNYTRYVKFEPYNQLRGMKSELVEIVKKYLV